MQGKTVAESVSLMHHLPMPDETNQAGSIHGGHLLKLIDNVGGVAACRHARTNVVTASLERMDFLTPIYPGELIILKASVNYAGKHSMEVGVRVEVEHMTSGQVRHAASCYLTYVAVDEQRNPCRVPPLLLSTDLERRRYARAEERRACHKEQAAAKAQP
ncbi:MAG: acyl-CoA thioesterase [Desulfovibrio sp.]|jgi:acyl-CoA hydrolase|nr:acyl-CoA thioesterase [Desulfovibrio sp.]